MKTVNTTCPECKSDKVLHDTHRDETFCTECGLIIQDNSIKTISIYIKERNQKSYYIKSLWRGKK